MNFKGIKITAFALAGLFASQGVDAQDRWKPQSMGVVVDVYSYPEQSECEIGGRQLKSNAVTALLEMEIAVAPDHSLDRQRYLIIRADVKKTDEGCRAELRTRIMRFVLEQPDEGIEKSFLAELLYCEQNAYPKGSNTEVISSNVLKDIIARCLDQIEFK